MIVNWTLPSPGGIVTGTRLSLVMMVFGLRPFVNHRQADRQVDLPGPAGRAEDDPALHADPHRQRLAVELALARGLADADLIAQVHRGIFGRVGRDVSVEAPPRMLTLGHSKSGVVPAGRRAGRGGRWPTQRRTRTMAAGVLNIGRRAARQHGAKHDGRRHGKQRPVQT